VECLWWSQFASENAHDSAAQPTPSETSEHQSLRHPRLMRDDNSSETITSAVRSGQYTQQKPLQVTTDAASSTQRETVAPLKEGGSWYRMAR